MAVLLQISSNGTEAGNRSVYDSLETYRRRRSYRERHGVGQDQGSENWKRLTVAACVRVQLTQVTAELPDIFPQIIGILLDEPPGFFGL